MLIREKRSYNSIGDKRYSVIYGINIAVHEFGHLLNWGHTSLGNYCVMNAAGKENTNCPPHVNIIYKLQSGWISNNRIRFVSSPQEVLNLPDNEHNGDCAVMTIYGKPGYDNKWNHSEYFVFENKRMARDEDDWTIKFDRKLVWYKDLNPATPGNFTGGCLVTHYNSFSGTSNLKIICADPDRPSDLLYDVGNHRVFLVL